jgi:hypothetical protein
MLLIIIRIFQFLNRRYSNLTYPPNPPAQLIALRSEIVMAKLLDIKVVDLECCMCYCGPSPVVAGLKKNE